jgi:hypothetical protein
MINVENVMIFELSSLSEGEEELSMLQEIEDLVSYVQSEFKQVTLLQKKFRETHKGKQELLRIFMKAQVPTKVKCNFLMKVKLKFNDIL